ncbi:unnamed protein product, partial [Didymodactylos carnosus]
ICFLSEDLTLDLQDFLNYFEDTYIGRLRASGVRANPKFAVELWNMHSRTDQAMLRSNNHVEGKLKTEESSLQLDLAAINAGQEAKIQQKRYADHNKRLINLIKYPHPNIEQQIAATAHNIHL